MKIDQARFIKLTRALSATALATASVGACTGNFKGNPSNGSRDAGEPPTTPPSLPNRPPVDAGTRDAGDGGGIACPAERHEPNDTTAWPLAYCSTAQCATLESVASGSGDRDVFVFRGETSKSGCTGGPSFRLGDPGRRLCVSVRCSTGANALDDCGSGYLDNESCCVSGTSQMDLTINCGPCVEAPIVDVYMTLDPLEDACTTYKVTYGF